MFGYSRGELKPPAIDGWCYLANKKMEYCKGSATRLLLNHACHNYLLIIDGECDLLQIQYLGKIFY
jgi:hypothetical protein